MAPTHFWALSGSVHTEYTRFSINPDIIYLNTSMSLTESSKDLVQVDCYMYEDGMEKFVKAISDATGVAIETLSGVDVLFGVDKTGRNPLGYISVDLEQSEEPDADNGYDLQDTLGIMLQSGDNGEFGDAPFGTTAWTDKVVEFYGGEFDDSIYNHTQYVIDAVVDANYPLEVKKAILALAEFRQDFFYFRDAGLDKYTYDQVKMVADEYDHSKFAATYFTTYDVVDPYSRKQINVTMMYSMAVALINHFNLRRNSPCCGIQFGFIFDDAIKGTVNFIPKYTPKFDQKTELMDLGLNYCSYIGNRLVLETTNTSQDPFSQFSYINNVLAVQQVIKAIRELCPKIRYSFLDGDDLSKYKKDVNDLIITKYAGLFQSFSVEYVDNDLYASNKIIYACLYVQFRNFVQTEIFKIIALPS